MRTTLPGQVLLAQPGGQICPAGFCLESNAEIRSERPQAAPRGVELLAALKTFRDHALAVSEAVRLIRNQ